MNKVGKKQKEVRKEIISETKNNGNKKSTHRNIVQEGILLPQKVVLQIADEVAKRLKRRSISPEKKNGKNKIENPLFLDTSAIIDGRFFDLVKLGVFYGNFVLLDSVLSELKNIADSKDDIKKERGRRALRYLDDVKKQSNVKLINMRDNDTDYMVDDKVIQYAKRHKGRVVTCDYNLSQKAKISGVMSIDIHELANIMKTQAVPGETYFIKVVQKGKGENQGVGYLPDGTMIVIEKGEDLIGKTVKVTVSRIIQTDAGKILFAKIGEGI